MKLRVIPWCLAVVLALLAGGLAPLQTSAGKYPPGTPPRKRLNLQRTWFLSVGVHKFQDDHLHPGRLAVVRQDIGLVQTLVDRGVPRDHIIALFDEDATSSNCTSALQQILQRAEADDVLMIFIHSHGGLSKGGLIATYETGGYWRFEELVRQIESQFAGRTACLFVGACHSGSLIDVARQAAQRVSYFLITSVSADRSALTVATADFEACIKDAFDGSPCPDLDNDGFTRFNELGEYITRDQSTLFGTTPQVAAIGPFDDNLILGDARPKDGPRDCQLVRVQGGSKGRIIKQQGNQVLVRGAKRPGEVQWVRSERARRI